MNVAIITARAGSKSIINKNVFSVSGKPIIHYPIQASLDAKKIDKVFVSTDGDLIANASKELGATIIPRPDELSGDTINHGIVIKHAVQLRTGGRVSGPGSVRRIRDPRAPSPPLRVQQ